MRACVCVYVGLKIKKKTGNIINVQTSLTLKTSTDLLYTVELHWFEHPWNHENMFETGKFKLLSVNHSARPGGIIEISFRFSLT